MANCIPRGSAKLLLRERSASDNVVPASCQVKTASDRALLEEARIELIPSP